MSTGFDTSAIMAPLRALGQKRLEAVLTDEEMFGYARDGLMLGLKKRGRTAQRIYWKLVGEVGSEARTQIATQVYIQIGARDERDARRMIDIVREAEEKPIEHRIDDAAAWMARVLTERPDLRARAAERLAPVLHSAPQLEPHANGKENGAA